MHTYIYIYNEYQGHISPKYFIAYFPYVTRWSDLFRGWVTIPMVIFFFTKCS